MAALEQTEHLYNVNSYADMSSHKWSSPTMDGLSPQTAPREHLTVNDYRPCGDQVSKGAAKGYDRRMNRVAEAVLKTFGDLFPFKDV